MIIAQVSQIQEPKSYKYILYIKISDIAIQHSVSLYLINYYGGFTVLVTDFQEDIFDYWQQCNVSNKVTLSYVSMTFPVFEYLDCMLSCYSKTRCCESIQRPDAVKVFKDRMLSKYSKTGNVILT